MASEMACSFAGSSVLCYFSAPLLLNTQLPRSAHHQAGEQHLGYIFGRRRGHRLPVPISKQPHLMTPSIFFDYFDRALPALKLRGVQLPQMQHPALQHSFATYPQALTKRIINMMLALFEYPMGL
jgi:hypothetical protein